jgi:hypothetical protein
MIASPLGVVNVCGSALASNVSPQMALATPAANAREINFLTVIFIKLLPYCECYKKGLQYDRMMVKEMIMIYPSRCCVKAGQNRLQAAA